MKLQIALKTKVFFARPYAYWQRGLNEHTNGLVRQYFPKGTDLTSVSAESLQKVEDLLNNQQFPDNGFNHCYQYVTWAPFEVLFNFFHC